MRGLAGCCTAHTWHLSAAVAVPCPVCSSTIGSRGRDDACAQPRVLHLWGAWWRRLAWQPQVAASCVHGVPSLLFIDCGGGPAGDCAAAHSNSAGPRRGRAHRVVAPPLRRGRSAGDPHPLLSSNIRLPRRTCGSPPSWPLARSSNAWWVGGWRGLGHTLVRMHGTRPTRVRSVASSPGSCGIGRPLATDPGLLGANGLGSS